MPHYDFDIGIIGGGAAGLTIAAGAAQLGAKTLLVEKENVLGGDCLHFGCVPSKTLIRTSKIYHLMKHAEKYGLPKIDIPRVEYHHITRRIRSVIDTIQHHDSEERFCGLGAKVEFGTPVFTDEYSIKVKGKSFSAKNWVISTGSSPAVPPIKGLDKTSFITNKEIFSIDRLPDSMIILGAGPVGIEMAQAFSRLGTAVTVIDHGGQILKKEDADMADTLMKILQSEGITFHLNARVEEVRENSGQIEAVFSDPENTLFRISARTLLVASGRRANTEGLGLETVGIEFDNWGITVDQRLRTTRSHIYAAGDVNGDFQFTHAAGYEGSIVISNAIFHLPRKVDYRLLPWCTYTDPELAHIGLNEKSARAEGIRYSVWTESFSENDRSLAEGENRGWIKMLLDDKEKPIGVQILGLHAGDLLGEWVAALNGNIKLSSLASAVHPYPTLCEINKRVVGNFFSPKIFSEKIKKGLKFFFNLKGRACELH
jgi:pyruvate/2-oxoglutarate dehydrogenase complex dihydrolipoamide dehydrogenase (E3) component